MTRAWTGRVRGFVIAGAATLAGPAARAQDQHWGCVQPTAQAENHRLAFDSRRGVLALWTERGSTYEWDGTLWRLRSTTGPEVRNSPGLAYDAGRGVTVLYGGGDFGHGYRTDLWEWDGSVWTRREQSGPSPREGFGFAYDPVRGVSVLHGGYYRYDSRNQAYMFLGDVWEWDGAQWRRSADGIPGGGAGETMCFDTRRGVIQVAGGSTDWPGSGGLGEWDPVRRTGRAAPDSPPGIKSIAYDERRGVTVALTAPVWGQPGQTWEWDGDRWTQAPDGAFASNYGAKLVYDVRRREVLELGGVVEHPGEPYDRRSGLFRWSGARWEAEIPDGPLPRSGPAAVFDPLRGEVMVVGGNENGPGAIPRTWLWRDGRWRSVATPQAVTGRMSQASCFDSARGVSIVFGGRVLPQAVATVNETWTWDGAAWTLAASTGPSPRGRASMAFDQARGVAVLFGGSTGSAVLSDTWEWDGARWTQKAIPGPSPRMRHGMAYDERRGVVVLFGGTVDDAAGRSDTWEYDGAAWTRRAPIGPAPRHNMGMVYDRERGAVRVFGGIHMNSYLTDSWLWDGQSWVDEGVPMPEPRISAGVAYLGDSGRTFVVGGIRTSALSDVWILGADCPSPAITAQPRSQAVCGAAGLELSVAAEAPGAVRYQWRTGEPRHDIPGADGPVFRLARATLADAGGYDCVVSCGGPCFPVEVVSDAAVVAVCIADFDCDGMIDAPDYARYIAAYETGDVSADVNGDGFLDFFDHDAFVEAFEAGC